MSDKRIDQLPATPGFAFTDLIEKERDPAGLKKHEKVTLQQLADWLLGQLNYNVFPTTAALRLNSIYVDSKVYCILGDNAKGDGNARIYYFDSVSVLLDNGASVIKPTAINVINSGRYLQFNA